MFSLAYRLVNSVSAAFENVVIESARCEDLLLFSQILKMSISDHFAGFFLFLSSKN